MLILVRTLSIVIVISLWPGQRFAMLAVPQPRVRVEFRWADTSPGKGLTEASLAGTDEKIYLHKDVVITNNDIIEAHAVEDPYRSGGIFQVTLLFTKAAAERMAKAAEAHSGDRLAILVNGKVISAPIVHGRLYDRVAISGPTLRKDEAERIAAALNRESGRTR